MRNWRPLFLPIILALVFLMLACSAGVRIFARAFSGIPPERKSEQRVFIIKRVSPTNVIQLAPTRMMQLEVMLHEGKAEAMLKKGSSLLCKPMSYLIVDEPGKKVWSVLLVCKNGATYRIRSLLF